MPRAECQSCRFAEGPIPTNGGDVAHPTQYRCRRFPPPGYEPEWKGSVPLMPHYGWCGEFRRGTPEAPRP